MWVIMIYHCRFIHYNKCITLMWNMDGSRGLCMCVDKVYMETLYFIFSFSMNLNSSKNTVDLKAKK